VHPNKKNKHFMLDLRHMRLNFDSYPS
jgi:hypothetical protein